MELLPDDMVADVLRRLPPSSLAAARCVCKHWCSIIDGRRLLHAKTNLLPLRLDGVFCNRHHDDQHKLHKRFPYFFARPRTARRIAGDLDFVFSGSRHDDDRRILDHCNGLLLLGLDMAVANPATRQWATLPPFPEPISLSMRRRGHGEVTTVEDDDLFPYFYLIYDPMAAAAAHQFEVYLVPDLMFNTCELDGRLEWPPSPYTLHVFSSSKWRWEERPFVRQGEPAGTIADMVHPARDDYRDSHGFYFQGALYVYCCRIDCVMRIALSDNEYQVIKLPSAGSQLGPRDVPYLGKSEKGVYSALLCRDDANWPHFRVWLLDLHKMEWVLRSDISLQAVVGNFATSDFASRYSKPWILADYDSRHKEEKAPAASAQDYDEDDEWDFDNGGVVLETKDDEAKRHWPLHIFFLGFHPYKEIALFSSSARVLCYQLNTSNVQELGLFDPPFGMDETSFLYTPCMLSLGAYLI